MANIYKEILDSLQVLPKHEHFFLFKLQKIITLNFNKI